MRFDKVNPKWTEWYETQFKDKNGNRGSYTTKSHTKFHDQIHEAHAEYGRVVTMKHEKDDDWVFGGIFSEIIKTTK